MQTVQINNNKYTGPSTWEELTAATLLLISQVLICKKVEGRQTKNQLAMRLMGIPFGVFKHLRESQRVQLHTTIEWLFTKNTLKNWLIPKITINRQTFYGPKHRLADLTGEEFMHCERVWGNWIFDQDTKHLNTLLAVLYRKKDFFGRKRAPFSAENAAVTERTLAHAAPWLKHAISTNYAGIRNHMIELHPNIWKKTISLQDEPGSNDQTSWARIFLDMSGAKFGPYPETVKTNIWLLLADLDKQAADAEELRRKYKV